MENNLRAPQPADNLPAPLSGRTIVVTRSREQASALSLRLRALGAHVIEIPTIAIVPPTSYEPLDAALAALHTYDWLIVTSANTARVLGERSQALGQPVLLQPPTVAVGPSTAQALRAVGLQVDLIPEPAVAESIVSALKGKVAGRRILLARAEIARDLLPHALEQAGAQVTIVDAYRTLLDEGSVPLVTATFPAIGDSLKPSQPQSETPVAEAIQVAGAMPAARGMQAAGAMQAGGAMKIDALTFTSSSTVRNLVALLAQAARTWPPSAKVISIGPITSSTLREFGIEPHAEARQHDVEGLIDALLQELADISPPAG